MSLAVGIDPFVDAGVCGEGYEKEEH